jgi:hypothetical protein
MEAGDMKGERRGEEREEKEGKRKLTGKRKERD